MAHCFRRVIAQISFMQPAFQSTSRPLRSQEISKRQGRFREAHHEGSLTPGAQSCRDNSCLRAAHLLKVKMLGVPGRMARLMRLISFRYSVAVLSLGLLALLCPPAG